MVSKDTVTGEPFSSNLFTPALTRLSKERLVRVAVKEVAPFGIVTFSATLVPFTVLLCAFASAYALAIAPVMDFSSMDAFATPFCPAVVVPPTGTVTVAAAPALWVAVSFTLT